MWLCKKLEKSSNIQFVPGELVRQLELSHFMYMDTCLISLKVQQKKTVTRPDETQHSFLYST